MSQESRDAARLAAWGRIRANGKARFVLSWGVLGWGVTTAVLSSALMAYSNRQGALAFQPFMVKLLVHLGPSLVLFPLAGIFFGSAMWALSERRHHRAKAAAGTPATEIRGP